ncbi:hypothetical protein [Mycobacterium intracellulare]|uniref:Uncharacterized protein n=1 Tax=Mycobacterium intracellulare TaxID=1767 RepID=A0AAE4RA11_MYCIT|nr:hypothetical protein [Mycobacterium intracellulare]MDV6975295.1 hypothetical protein [Mycobacterium intracellulare]MDV6980359.1 hypothetical protein [Mycobacterium intracellulare]MDV7010788.1 hypothetical protein [Mycobacterium intracellulare]MDV7025694.1 hypothetical protein [Mycobacterium intracellulare]
MTFYNLPGVDAKIEFDAKTKILEITGLNEHDRVVHSTSTGAEYKQSVRVELAVR